MVEKNNIWDKFNAVDSLLESPQDNLTLYHYTNGIATIGILHDKKIFCTRINFLNDVSEIFNGWYLFRDELESFKIDDAKFVEFMISFKEKWSGLLNYLNPNLDSSYKKLWHNLSDTYVFSMSRKYDDLNQWRSYSKEDNGYCIGFNINNEFFESQTIFKSKVNETASGNCDIYLKKCVYKEDDKRKIIREYIKSKFSTFKNGEKWDSMFVTIELNNLFSFFKHSSFSDEQEYRLLVCPPTGKIFVDNDDVNYKNFRPGKSYLIPYIKLDTNLDCIKSVCIGPTPSREYANNAIRLIFGYDEPNKHIITHSALPYRNW